jgi:hypothetical protein
MSRQHGRSYLSRLRSSRYLAKLRLQAYAAVVGRFSARA